MSHPQPQTPIEVIDQRLAARKRQLQAAKQQVQALAGAITELDLLKRQLTTEPPAAEPADEPAP